MKRKKTSPIWLLPEENFITLIQTSKRMKDVLGFFNLKNKGGNNRTVWARINYLKLNTNHFLKRLESSQESRKVTLDYFKKNILIKDSERSRRDVKKYLIKFNLLEWKCFDCGNDGTWNNKKLNLQLEHKNGVYNDNRLENLCFLCPNCHSQTDTYCGRNK